MKVNLPTSRSSPEPGLIASFGDAEIVRHMDGRYELRGGTPEDRAAARAWASSFMQWAVLHPQPDPPAKHGTRC